MAHSILAFGLARELLGVSELNFNTRVKNVGELRQLLLVEYPVLSNLEQLRIAVNQIYAEDEEVLDGNEEIALLPPVSGG